MSILWKHASLIALAFTTLLSASSPRLSVLYFDNLSGRDRNEAFGKALAEMLISDLSQVNGITVVERRKLEELNRELALGLTGLVDEATAPKVGRMLGAAYIMAGTYDISRRDVMVTYKVVNVETAAIVAAGTAEGASSDIAAVKTAIVTSALDRMTEALPGLKPAAAGDDESVALEEVVAYGEALEHSDRGDYDKARSVLQGLLGKKPRFRYAEHALSDLEARIAEYDKRREEALRRERDQPLTWQSFTQVTVGYTSSMQYTKLLEYCRDVRENPPPAPEGSMVDTRQLADYYVVLALYSLKRWEELIPEAERFLERYPSSMYYSGVKTYLSQGAGEIAGRDTKRKRAEEAAAPLIAKLEAAEAERRPFLLFQIAMAYLGEGAHSRALEYFRRLDLRALEKLNIPGDDILLSIFMCYYHLQDKKEAGKVLKTTEAFYPESKHGGTMRTMMNVFPE
ncbi:MAG: tetratricopeptide repeat protein [Chitinivibrionales bacterium]|nr:tetratricopeptide repeat protein [Chitinivibrionales bacterium]